MHENLEVLSKSTEYLISLFKEEIFTLHNAIYANPLGNYSEQRQRLEIIKSHLQSRQIPSTTLAQLETNSAIDAAYGNPTNPQAFFLIEQHRKGNIGRQNRNL